MAKSKKNPKVDAYIERAKQWKKEFEKLRAIALGSSLTEEFKWGHPCYTLDGKNVVLIHGFKEYCALLFMKGALMKDPEGILIQQTENVQSARQIRFADVDEVKELEPFLKQYIQEAIRVEESGQKVERKKSTDLVYPKEFQGRLDAMPDLKAAFEALTPGRRRAYNLYFSQPKLAKTRESRIEKSIPQILEGKGLNDE